jgi:hypothetical protein
MVHRKDKHLFVCFILSSVVPYGRITEVFDPKGLREGMNRQDIHGEGQKADDQLANF